MLGITGLLLIRIALLLSLSLLASSRRHFLSPVILLAGQHLVGIVHLASFSLLATATTRCSFDLITTDLHSDVC